MWKDNNYTLRFNSNPFYRHEQVILAAGTFDGFLPMTFLRSASGLTVRYEPSGFLPLSGYRIERTQDALYLMEKTVLILHTAAEYLLAPERLTLRTNTVFYSRERDDLRIAFLPRCAIRDETSESGNLPGTGGPSPMQRELILFLAQLKQDICDQHGAYVLRLARELYYSSPSTSDMLRSIGLLRRELDARAKAGPSRPAAARPQDTL